MSQTPIEAFVDRWHQHMRGQFAGGLDELLADDVVFYSPVVYSPQRGKAITMMYLRAAAVALPGSVDSSDGATTTSASSSAFRYTKEVIAGDTAVLEFETTVDGKYVNGVDIIRVDARGKAIEFRVMIRPLQAVNAVHAQMKALLESMGG